MGGRIIRVVVGAGTGTGTGTGLGMVVVVEEGWGAVSLVGIG